MSNVLAMLFGGKKATDEQPPPPAAAAARSEEPSISPSFKQQPSESVRTEPVAGTPPRQQDQVYSPPETESPVPLAEEDRREITRRLTQQLHSRQIAPAPLPPFMNEPPPPQARSGTTNAKLRRHHERLVHKHHMEAQQTEQYLGPLASPTLLSPLSTSRDSGSDRPQRRNTPPRYASPTKSSEEKPGPGSPEKGGSSSRAGSRAPLASVRLTPAATAELRGLAAREKELSKILDTHDAKRQLALEQVESKTRQEFLQAEEELERVRAKIGLAAAREEAAIVENSLESEIEDLARDLKELVKTGDTPVIDAEVSGSLMGTPIADWQAEDWTQSAEELWKREASEVSPSRYGSPPRSPPEIMRRWRGGENFDTTPQDFLSRIREVIESPARSPAHGFVPTSIGGKEALRVKDLPSRAEMLPSSPEIKRKRVRNKAKANAGLSLKEALKQTSPMAITAGGSADAAGDGSAAGPSALSVPSDFEEHSSPQYDPYAAIVLADDEPLPLDMVVPWGAPAGVKAKVNYYNRRGAPLPPDGVATGSPSGRMHANPNRRLQIRERDMVANIDWIVAKPGQKENDCRIKEAGWVPAQAFFESLRYYPTEKDEQNFGESVVAFSGNTHGEERVVSIEQNVRTRLGITAADPAWRPDQLQRRWASNISSHLVNYNPARVRHESSRTEPRGGAMAATGASRGRNKPPVGRAKQRLAAAAEAQVEL